MHTPRRCLCVALSQRLVGNEKKDIDVNCSICLRSFYLKKKTVYLVADVPIFCFFSAFKKLLRTSFFSVPKLGGESTCDPTEKSYVVLGCGQATDRGPGMDFVTWA